ncbi:MAG: radical SAM protein [Planctomycetes bacterium]|nr:radical SAM protein [Planctomycetota bacterium]
MSDAKHTSYVYGPVPSRRLGRSLGVDLVPFKTCSYDCIYCQLGRTTNKTVECREWFPLDDVLRDVAAHLDSKPDFITLSGSGEPTLYSRIRQLVSRIRDMTDTSIAIITNGSLLWKESVRESLLGVDLVVPSLDAAGEETWRRVNRPHNALSFDTMVEGLEGLRREFKGDYWLEVLLLEGITATDDEVRRIAEIAARINPDKIHLNTSMRPPAESFARPVSRADMERFAGIIGEKAVVVADFEAQGPEGDFSARKADVLALLQRRPCTLKDVAAGLGVHHNEAIKYLDELSREGTVESRLRDGKTYYEATEGDRE